MSFAKKILALAIASIGTQSALAVEAADSADGSVVVVTATLRAHTIAAAPAFTTVVTEDDIAKSPVNSLADLLRETVGVNNMTDGTGRDEIQIRGLGGKYTLMLLNGRRVSSSGVLWRGGDFDFSSIPLNSIKRVEIVRGPMAALYGSDAIGGVVNIITKEPGKQWIGSVSSEYRRIASGTNGDQYRLGASTSGAINDKLSLSISGEMYDRQPWFSDADPIHAPRLEQKRSQNLMTTATWKLSETQTLDIDFGYNKDKRPYGMYYYAYFPQWNYESKDYREQEITRNTYGLNHKASWDWGTTTAYVSRESSSIDDFNSRYNKPQQRFIKEENTYAKLYANTNFGINAMTVGFDFRDQKISDMVYKSGGVSTRTSALFAEDEINLLKGLNLTLGGRFDKNDAFGNHFSPKTYLTYQANDAVTVKGGITKGFKAPDAYQITKEYSVVSCGGKCFLAGNPNLSPEKSTNYEIGVEVHQKAWNFTAVVFKNELDNMIVSLYDAAGPSRKWANVAKAKTRGLELQADVELGSGVSVAGNLTHLKAEYIDENGKLSKLDNRPENMLNLSLNWKATDNLQTTLAANYVGKQVFEGNDLPAYTRYDATFAAKLNKNTTLRFGVKNLTNVSLEEKNKNFQTFELGRNYYVSATYAF